MIKGEVKSRVLLFCETPKSFVEIHRESGIAQSSLAKFLKELQQEGFVTKTKNGKYVVTDEGKEVLEEIKAIEEFRKLYRQNKELALELLEEAKSGKRVKIVKPEKPEGSVLKKRKGSFWPFW